MAGRVNLLWTAELRSELARSVYMYIYIYIYIYIYSGGETGRTPLRFGQRNFAASSQGLYVCAFVFVCI